MYSTFHRNWLQIHFKLLTLVLIKIYSILKNITTWSKTCQKGFLFSVMIQRYHRHTHTRLRHLRFKEKVDLRERLKFVSFFILFMLGGRISYKIMSPGKDGSSLYALTFKMWQVTVQGWGYTFMPRACIVPLISVYILVTFYSKIRPIYYHFYDTKTSQYVHVSTCTWDIITLLQLLLHSFFHNAIAYKPELSFIFNPA